MTDTALYIPNPWPAGRTADWTFRTDGYDRLSLWVSTDLSLSRGTPTAPTGLVAMQGIEGATGADRIFLFSAEPGEQVTSGAVATLSAGTEEIALYLQAFIGDVDGDDAEEILTQSDLLEADYSGIEVFFSPLVGDRRQGEGDIQAWSPAGEAWSWEGADAFDLDGTGAPDLVLWSRGVDPEGTGQSFDAWYVFGDPGPGLLDPADADARVRATGGARWLQRPASGDIDGDGTLDLVVRGGISEDQGFGDTLADVVVLLGPFEGSRDVAEADIVVTASGDPMWDVFQLLAADTDLDADGTDDLVVLHAWSTFEPLETETEYLYFAGLRPGAWTVDDASAAAADHLGMQGEVVADLDADGLTDLVGGATREYRDGCMVVAWGPLLTAAPPGDHAICGDTDDTRYLGRTLAARDVDGDGLSEVFASTDLGDGLVLGWSGALLSEFLR